MENIIRVYDKLAMKDALKVVDGKQHKKTFRTKIFFGSGEYVDKKTGITYLDEVWDEQENETVFGGSIYTLEKLFNNRSDLQVETINNIMGINPNGTEEEAVALWPASHGVSFFMVGIGGSGDSIDSVFSVDFKQRELKSPVPFRIVDSSVGLSSTEKGKYVLRKTIPATETETEKYAYYGKLFESKGIRELWCDAEEGEDGSTVEGDVHNSTRTQPIEVFEEIVLKLTYKDINEYFGYNGNAQVSRVNEFGLVTGVPVKISEDYNDYKYCTLFSACNINNEMLKYARDTTILYRIYTN